MDKFRIKIDGFKCLRCGWEWKPQNNKELPTVCPNLKCKSPYWSKERRNARPKN